MSWLVFTMLFCIVGRSEGLVQTPKNHTMAALIVFGDSIVDAGNNNFLKTVVKCNFPPYGQDFAGGIPTGRFCDGKIPSDILAEQLGIKGVVPAYLDPNLRPEDLLTGVTFASGGTGYDPLTPSIVSVISLPQQLEYFKEYKRKLAMVVGEERANSIVTNSLYLLVAGSNDISNTYFILQGRKLQYDISSYTDLMLNFASEFVNELYQLGARRIGVFSAPPIGCVPSQRTLAGGFARVCAEPYNQAALLFNSKLSDKLDTLTTTLLDSRIVYIDIYSPLLDLIQYPQKYGFSEANRGCCGTGKIEVAILCNPLSPSVCRDSSDYVFWDSYHPTERAYRVIISQLIPKYIHRFL